jgi:hypothetical protein
MYGTAKSGGLMPEPMVSSSLGFSPAFRAAFCGSRLCRGEGAYIS